jgi:hypothetical protein
VSDASTCDRSSATSVATALDLGLSDANRLLRQLVQDAIESVPSCARTEALRAWAAELGDKLVRTSRTRTSVLSGVSTL